MAKQDERRIQYYLMNWLLNVRNQIAVIPNNKTMFWQEADLLSITKSYLVHEFEIKISKTDFLADRRKRRKHWVMRDAYDKMLGEVGRKPNVANYFWYAIQGFPLAVDEVPDYAGFVIINQNGFVNVEREAPRLYQNSRSAAEIVKLMRPQSFHLMREFEKYAEKKKRTRRGRKR